MQTATAIRTAIVSFCALFVTLMAGVTTEASTVTWGSPASITGPSDVSTVGTLERAYNFVRPDTVTGPFGPATVNGVTFATFGAANNPTEVTFDSTSLRGVGGTDTVESFNGLGSNSSPFASLSPSYQQLLATAVYNDGGGVLMTLNGLTPGTVYLLEAFANDSRVGANRTETLAAGNMVSLSYSTTHAEGGLGQFVTGTFTADSTGSQAVMFTNESPAVGSASQINAFELRVVPEPAALSLLLACVPLCLRRHGFPARPTRPLRGAGQVTSSSPPPG